MSRHHAAIKNDPRWHAARAEVFDRDGYACVDCGTGEDLQADHVVELHLDPDNLELALDPDNLVTRCGPCNRAKHHAGTTQVRQPWVNPRYPEVAALIGAAS